MRATIQNMSSYIKRTITYFKKDPGREILILIGAGVLLFGGVFTLWAATLSIPDFNSFEERKVAQSTRIYDRTGKVVLWSVQNRIRRTEVPFDTISHNLKNAAVAIEDAEFYQHHGIRPLAIFRAVFIQPLRGKGVQGGSTITQQVVKNALLTPEKTLKRKIKEWILAIKLERILTKEEILSIYLNESPYGGTIYGAEEAAQEFFGKSSSDLTIAEAAYLAALPNAPTYYSPYGKHTNELNERKDLVINRMVKLGFITAEEGETAKKEVVIFRPAQDHGIKAPHFVFYVLEQLEERYGKDVLETGGLRVYTTLDWELQQKAEELVATYGEKNEKDFGAKNAGLVAIDPKNGHILTMVGSRDFFDVENQGNFNVTTAHRQPGSSFKPFVYATAFAKGYTPDTVVFDVPTEFQTTCNPDGTPKPGESADNCYKPDNYDHKFRGPMSLRDALAQSVNIPAIKVLYLAGLDDSLETARRLGITSLTNKDRYGLTLVLGGGEVSLLEMVSAYGAFANDGERHPHVGILKIEDREGKLLEEWSPRPERVLEENVARLISSVLSDNQARIPAFGANSPLYFPGRDVAAKTGTTNDSRDAWIVGYTPDIVAGTWVGNNDNTAMERRVAGFIVAPMWQSFMQEALKTLPESTFVPPEPTRTDIKPILRGIWQGGGQPNSSDPSLPTFEPVATNVHSILYWVDKDDPLGPPPANPAADSQFYLWEAPVLAWARANGYGEGSMVGGGISPLISIESPENGSALPRNEPVTIRIRVNNNATLTEANFFVNGTPLGSMKIAPFNYSFVPQSTPGIQSENVLTVVVYDSAQNRGESSISFRVLP